MKMLQLGPTHRGKHQIFSHRLNGQITKAHEVSWPERSVSGEKWRVLFSSFEKKRKKCDESLSEINEKSIST